MSSNQGVTLRKSRSKHEDERTISNLDCPYAAGCEDEVKPRTLPFSKRNYEAYIKSGPSAVVFWMGVTMALIVFFAEDPNDYPSLAESISTAERRLNDSQAPERITFLEMSGKDHASYTDRSLPILSRETFGKPDYGGIRIYDKVEDQSIYFERVRGKYLHHIDGPLSSSYYAQEDKEDEDPECRPPSWTGYNFPACNGVHELTIGRVFDNDILQDFEVSYLK